MSKPVRIRYERDGRYAAGAEFVVTAAAAARTVHPEAIIVAYADGTPYRRPPARPPRPRQAQTERAPSGPAPDGPDAAAEG